MAKQRSPADEPPIDAYLLRALLHSPEPMSMELLASRSSRGAEHVPQSVLTLELERLRCVGCEIEHHPQRGVRLIRSGIGAWADYIRAEYLSSFDAAGPIEIYRKTASTQDAARRMIKSLGVRANRGVVCAEEQTAGRGRLGRKWVSVPGRSLTFTFVFMGNDNSKRLSVDRLMFSTAVAIARAVDAVAPPGSPRAQIKWPNDVLLNRKKVAGVLVEGIPMEESPTGSAWLIGIGLNVSLTQDDFEPLDEAVKPHVTSLLLESIDIDRLPLLVETIFQTESALEALDPAPLIAEWRERCVHLHQRLTLLHNGKSFTGHLVDLDPFDGLIFRSESGEIHHFPAASTTIL